MKLIKINTDHYVIVDDSEIKEGDWYYHIIRKIIHNTSEKADYFVNNTKYNDFKKITHSTQPLYKNDFWAIQELKLSEVKELLGEVDVEKKILDLYNQFPLHPMEKMYPLQGATKRFIEFVYNQALEDNKDKKYTEDDLKKAICIAKDSMGVDNDGETCYSHLSTEQIIQPLQPKKEWEVEFDENGKLKLKQ